MTIGTSYKIGDAIVTRFTETTLKGLKPSSLYPEWKDEALDDYQRSLVLGDPSENRENVHLSVHSWLIDFDGQRILVDTGIGNGKDRPFGKHLHQLQTPFLERLRSAGVAPENVDYVLLTHLHVDHVGWNTQLMDGRWVPTFPNAKYVFPKVEHDFFSTPEGASRRMVFEDSILPLIKSGQAETIRAEGGKYRDVFTFHPTPGHSIGHMSISLKSGAEEALFAGDVMHNAIQVYKPHLGSAFCADLPLAQKSRLWLLNYAADRGSTLFTGHFPGTSAGRVFRRSEGFGWRYI
ncbi:MAG: MBL fold metallo-hydrolase [Methylovirgula sp.]|uniref:MBL fold metallo-hydrolase n=1 Tax=Methylovirgula sp. TaxID=1978224 RepID=UPI0030766F1B